MRDESLEAEICRTLRLGHRCLVLSHAAGAKAPLRA